MIYEESFVCDKIKIATINRDAIWKVEDFWLYRSEFDLISDDWMQWELPIDC